MLDGTKWGKSFSSQEVCGVVVGSSVVDKYRVVLTLQGIGDPSVYERDSTDD